MPPSVEELFTTADSNGEVLLSKDELSALASRGGPGRPCGLKGQPPGNAEDSSSKRTTQDPADTNQDGKVSQAERRAHGYRKLVHSQAATSTSTDLATRSAVDVPS